MYKIYKMNYLIRLYTVVVALTITTELSAQNYGVRAGLNLSNMLLRSDGVTNYNGNVLHPGFHLGVTTEFPISQIFSFETGLIFTKKGYKFNLDAPIFPVGNYTQQSQANLYYLDIPLTAKVIHELNAVKLYGVFGPYMGLGMSGRVKSETIKDGETQRSEIDVEWGANNYKRFDFGLIIGAGVEIKSIQLGLTYNLGLANVLADSKNDTRLNNRVIALTVGYRFASK